MNHENSISRHEKGAHLRNVELIGVRPSRGTGELLGVFASYAPLRDILSESPPEEWRFGYDRYHVAGPRQPRPLSVLETQQTQWFLTGRLDFGQWTGPWIEDYDFRLAGGKE